MAKDWVGNSSTFRTLGASNHTDRERQKEDYYATEPKATEWLCKLEQSSQMEAANQLLLKLKSDLSDLSQVTMPTMVHSVARQLRWLLMNVMQRVASTV